MTGRIPGRTRFDPFVVRGFVGYRFEDEYRLACSIQEASRIGTEAALWLGVENVNPQIRATDAARFGVDTAEHAGWVPYPLPSDVALHTRMCLTQSQVRDLLPMLQRFAETGELVPTHEARE